MRFLNLVWARRVSSFALVFLLSAKASALIYGKDDRRDLYSSVRALQLAKSTATMVADAFILPHVPRTEADETTLFDLDFAPATTSYGLNLCSEEKFSEQPAGWLNCTGFLVAEDILVTAGHCVIFNHAGSQGVIENNVPPSTMCDSFAWVFDFSQETEGVPVKTKGISPDNVYRCGKVLYAASLADSEDPITGQLSTPAGGEHGNDFAIIQLDRKVLGRKPWPLATTSVANGDPLLVIGYPSALPAKYAPGKVIAANYKNYFASDLDITSGNSGSPVFNSKNEVAGLIVRGAPPEDYEYLEDRECFKDIVCPKIGEGDCVSNSPEYVLGAHAQKTSPVQAKLLQILNAKKLGE